MIYRCEECGVECSSMGAFMKHLNMHPNLNKEDYYNKYILNTTSCSFCGGNIPFENKKYGPTCSQSCYVYSKKNKNIEHMIRCKLCKKPYNDQVSINNHVGRSHSDYGAENYYKNFVMKDGDPDGNCLWCGKHLKFIGIKDGYQKFCYNTDCNVRWYNENTNRHKIAGPNVSIALKKSRKMTNKKEYWLDMGFSEEESKLKISERQRTFTLEKCIAKYGEEAGRKRWQERQEKWHRNYKKTNFSKVSQELFWGIYEKLEDKSEIYFAQLNNGIMDDSGVNHEIVLKTNVSCCKPDFYMKKKNIIVEFDGTYWHNDRTIRRGNKQRKSDRDAEIINTYPDMRIIHISEEDFKNNKNEAIDRCIRFINE